jgi:nucleotide-binding universal stress UspA family protein
MFKRILVPLDGSKTAEKVLPVAIAEARGHGATLVVLRVIAPLRGSLMMIPSLIETCNESIASIIQNYLDDVVERLRSEGLDVETGIERGPPAQRILEFAESSECDLIIIGSRGETGIMRWRFGSVAHKVVKAKSLIPVMIVTTVP